VSSRESLSREAERGQLAEIAELRQRREIRLQDALVFFAGVRITT
jgi:hypothetical protein